MNLTIIDAISSQTSVICVLKRKRYLTCPPLINDHHKRLPQAQTPISPGEISYILIFQSTNGSTRTKLLRIVTQQSDISQKICSI